MYSTQEKKINVMIVDDHSMFRKGLSDTVREIRTVDIVSEAEDGIKAISLLQQNDYRIIFMDIKMPRMMGDAAAAIIHKQFPNTGIIGLSMYEDSFSVRRMFLAGCKGYITKFDCNENIIREAITTVASGKKYFNEKVFEMLVDESEEECFARLYKLYTLSNSESMIIRYICEGKINKQIADELNITIHTVEKYRNSAYHKIGVTTSVELMHFAIRNNIINADNL